MGVGDWLRRLLSTPSPESSPAAEGAGMAKDDDDVVIRLSRAKALALFEWAQRFMETHNQQFTHPADAIVIDTLATELEWALPEVFTDAYPALLAASRERVESKYRVTLGPDGAAWLASLNYQDVPVGRKVEPHSQPDHLSENDSP